jgi:glutamate racemase
VAKPIGIFDSGLGGLTVARAIRAALPAEDLVYLGDTARVPYGTRSAETVVKYAIGCAERLLSYDIKLLVVACNTASGVALAELERAIHAENRAIQVFAQAAPLFVPLAEEGWVSGEVPRLAAERYLAPLVEVDVDTIVLGCTHYPLLNETIHDVAAELLGHDLVVVDSAEATAAALREIQPELGAEAGAAGGLRILVTDLPGQFASSASRFLGKPVQGLDIEAIDL